MKSMSLWAELTGELRSYPAGDDGGSGGRVKSMSLRAELTGELRLYPAGGDGRSRGRVNLMQLVGESKVEVPVAGEMTLGGVGVGVIDVVGVLVLPFFSFLTFLPSYLLMISSFWKEGMVCRSLGLPTHLVPVYLGGHRCPRCQTMSAIV